MKSWTAPGLDVIHSDLLHSVSQLLVDGNQLSGLVVQTDPGRVQMITNDPRAGLLTSPPGDGSKLVNPRSDGPDQEGPPGGRDS